MDAQKQIMKPQDVIALLKIVNLKDKPWTQLTLADELFISQSEISASIARSKYADLLHANGKTVMDAVKLDTRLYEMLALVDALRVGKAREKDFAIGELKQMILDE
jgi:hypothetical protein